MNIVISNSGEASIEDADNFKAFKVVVRDGLAGSTGATSVGPVTFESHTVAWVSARWLETMSSQAEWGRALDAMIEKARPHGWIRDAPELAIRAHVERP